MLVARSLPFLDADMSPSDVPNVLLAPEFARERCEEDGPAWSRSDADVPGLSLTCNHTRMARTTSVYPLISARSSGVMPFLSGLSATAPQPRRICTTAVCPLAAAKWSGVEPAGQRHVANQLLTNCSDSWSIAATLALLRVSSRKTRGVDVGSAVNEHPDDADAPARARCVKWETAVQERVDRLAVRQGVVDETKVPACSSRVELEVWNWRRGG